MNLLTKKSRKNLYNSFSHTHTPKQNKSQPPNNILINKSNQRSEKSSTMKNLKKEFEEDKGNGIISQLH